MDEADSTIKFHCENCGRKFSVPQIHAGKKGKCPKCYNIISIPKIKSTGTTGQSSPGKTKTSSQYSDYDLTLLNITEKEKIQNQQASISEETAEYEQELERESAEETDALRRLPWFVDIFIYPISASGLVNLVILSLLPQRFLPLGYFNYWLNSPLSLGVTVVFVGYLLYCLSDYIRDSTSGSRRGPDIYLSPDVLLNAGEHIWPIINTFVCIVVCVGPLLAYLIITERIDIIFWLLVTYGVLFLPMVLLAVVLFDSLRALNPILIIASILNVFIPYTGLVLLFFVVCGLVTIILVIMPQSLIIIYILSAVCIYLTMVMAHLLGRFYRRYQEKLNWEV